MKRSLELTVKILANESYYDWEQKHKKRKNKESGDNSDEINTLGIRKALFKDELKKWREKNLKKKDGEKS